MGGFSIGSANLPVNITQVNSTLVTNLPVNITQVHSSNLVSNMLPVNILGPLDTHGNVMMDIEDVSG